LDSTFPSADLRFHPTLSLIKALFILIIVILCGSLPSLAEEQATGADTLISSSDTDSQPVVQPPRAATNVQVKDAPNDAGGSIDVSWMLSPDDGEKVTEYKILRAGSIDVRAGEFIEAGTVPAGETSYRDGNAAEGVAYFYKILTVSTQKLNGVIVGEASSESEAAGPISSSAQWFDWRRINVLVATVVLTFLILAMISQAKSGKKLFVRKIAGMEAVDEAVGRATEMGRKIYYVPGIQDMDNMQTIASMTILGRVAELAAQYETWLEVPVCKSLVMVTAKEVVKEAHAKVGRPDAYHENQVHYLTDDQFGYAAAIDGMVVREQPATIFYMGAFFAESLILAETGNASGAIQIAGTAMPAQLPFFVAACDYTLIGEELFAASAYLSKDPKLLGSLKGQDYGKALLLISIIVGIVFETFGIWDFSNLFSVIE
jgi:hypothetical protein